MSDISDLSPKAQELYHKIMSGKYLTEQSDDIPLPMRRYFCQALHLVRSWFESHQDQMRLYCMNNSTARANRHLDGDALGMKKRAGIKVSELKTEAFIGNKSCILLFLSYWLPTRRTRQQNEHHLQAIPLANR